MSVAPGTQASPPKIRADRQTSNVSIRTGVPLASGPSLKSAVQPRNIRSARWSAAAPALQGRHSSARRPTQRMTIEYESIPPGVEASELRVGEPARLVRQRRHREGTIEGIQFALAPYGRENVAGTARRWAWRGSRRLCRNRILGLRVGGHFVGRFSGDHHWPVLGDRRG